MVNPYYPAFLDLRGRRAVVLGGGPIAARKVHELLLAEADILVVAPEAEASIVGLAQQGRLVWRQTRYEASDLDGAFLLIAATDSREVNARAAQHARARGVLVNAVDDPPNCDFIAPAVVRRGPLSVAVSTGGLSPAYARFVRETLDELLGDEYGLLLAAAAEARERLARAGSRPTPARWQCALRQTLAEMRSAPHGTSPTQLLLAALGQPAGSAPAPRARRAGAKRETPAGAGAARGANRSVRGPTEP
jgi:precorrin-2 dehydrogenase/sirohydrochlorin ferrochelatase